MSFQIKILLGYLQTEGWASISLHSKISLVHALYAVESIKYLFQVQIIIIVVPNHIKNNNIM
jgi:hypothetical protein